MATNAVHRPACDQRRADRSIHHCGGHMKNIWIDVILTIIALAIVAVIAWSLILMAYT
jgi:hypothetical protein